MTEPLVPDLGVRPATAGDEEPIREIARDFDNLDSWPERPDYLDHELTTGLVLVGERDGDVVGFGGVLVRGDVVHLADLFVRKDLLGKGIGGAILRGLLDASPPEAIRVTFASSDPRALPLYAMVGMRPVMPVVYLSGSADAARAVAAEGQVRLAAGDELRGIAALDATASGRTRDVDHAFLASLPSAEALVVEDGAGVRAFAWVRLTPVVGGSGLREAFVGPVGARSEAEMSAMVAGVVRAVADRAAAVHVSLLGPNPALATLLRAGFRVVDRDTLMSSRVDLIDGRTYAPSLELG